MTPEPFDLAAPPLPPGIPFTQFLRPDGRQRPQWIERPADIEARARRIIEAGYRFEIEELTTGMIHMDVVSYPDECEQLTNELVPNGLGVPAAVDRLVNAAFNLLFPAEVQPCPATTS